MLRKKYDLDVDFFDLRVSAHRDPDMDNRFTEFGAELLTAPAIFLLQHEQTNKQTNKQTKRQMNIQTDKPMQLNAAPDAGGYTAGMGE